MDTKELQAYAKLQAQIKELEDKRDAMKSSIMQRLAQSGIVKEVTKFGTFTRAFRTAYTYSDKVAGLIEKVKLAKIREEEKGIATPATTEYLVYTPSKH